MRRILILILTLFSVNCQAQYNCLFHHYSTQDGLSHGGITNSLMDRNGFLWFGTIDGINRFDGNNFVTYKSHPGDKISLSSNRIEEVKEDYLGFLWIRTYDNKVYRFNKKTEKFTGVVTDLSVDRIFLSSLGEVWITTKSDGVFRIVTDTNNFNIRKLHYNVGLNGELNPGTLIFEDNLHRVWVNTPEGLYCLDISDSNKGKTIVKFSQSLHTDLKKLHVNCFARADDLIMCGTAEGVLLQINCETFKYAVFDFGNKSPVTSINSKLLSSIIVGTNGNGIYKINHINGQILKHENSKILRNVYFVFIDSRKLIWLETDNAGVVKINSDFKELKHFTQLSDITPTLATRIICSFFEDNDNVLWIGLKGSGFGYYSPETDSFEYFYNKPGDRDRKMSNFVVSFLKDTTGVMWISTYNKGLEKIIFPENKFRFKQLAKGSINRISNEVRAIYQDKKGRLWVATKEGIVYILDKDFNILQKISDEIDNGLVYSITQDSGGYYWLATKGKGLYRLEESSINGKFKYIVFRHNQNDSSTISSDFVYSVISDKEGRIWVGTFGGGPNLLIKDAKGNYQIKNINNSFVNYPKSLTKKVRQVLEDSKGNIWLATTDGIIWFNPNENAAIDDINFYHFFKVPGDASSLGNNDVLCIYKDGKDTLWFGTMGGGLHKLINQPDNKRSPRFKIYSKSDGLPNEVILGIISDENNDLWLSTENGISNFKRSIDAFRNYDEYEGLNATYFSETAIFRKTDGEILCGTFDGIYSFYPSELSIPLSAIRLVFTGLTIFSNTKNNSMQSRIVNTSVTANDIVELKYFQNMFSIDYTGLDYKTRHKLQYAYMLDGLDETWHFVNNNQTATYTNIPPGRYRFKVKIVNPDVVNNNVPIELEINIQAPPWKTVWAKIGYIVFFLVFLEIVRRTVTTMIRLRNSVVIEQELTNLKLRFFTNISHELRTPLTLILGPIEDIAQKEKLTDRGKEHLLILEKNARRMLRLINQILDFRKIQNKKMKLNVSEVEIVSFVEDVAANFKDIARQKNIYFTVNTSIKKTFLWIDAEKIDIVIFNLLSNAFKFTPQGKSISVDINKSDNSGDIVIQVRDEGIGIPAEKIPVIFSRFADVHRHSGLKDTGTGIGLSLSKEFIDLHKGTITFNSIENTGTTFTFLLKAGKHHFDNEITEYTDGNNEQPATAKGYDNLPDRTESFDKHDYIAEDGALPLVIIVEDDADMRKFLLNQFEGIFQVAEAENGKIGLQFAEKLQPDLIISDLMMPELDGIELTDKLRNNFATSHIPIILLTAKSSIESRLEGLKYGADDYITKPFESVYLIARIKNLLQLRKNLYNKFSDQIRIIDIPLTTPTVTDKDKEFLELVTGIIEENFDKSSFQIESISKETGLGRTNFFKKLKSLTGLAPIEFVNEIRLRKAAAFIESKTYTISEVAYKVGFNDAGYFTKCFKEKYGCTPTNYLKNIKTE